MTRVSLSILLIGALCIICLPVKSQGFDWAAHFSSTSDVQVNSVVYDPGSDEATAIIVFQGTVSYNGGPVYTSLGDRDIMLVRMESDGDTLWTRRYGSTGKELPKDLALDASGNIYATGSFSDGADFGGTVLNTLDAEDVFLIKVNTAGSVLWARNVAGGERLDRGNSLIVNNLGNVVVAGFFQDSIIFETDTLVTNGQNNNFVAVYNNDGDFIEAVHLINTLVNSDRINSVSLAHDGGSMISGFFRDSIKINDPVLGLVELKSGGQDDMVLIKFNPDLEIEWARTGGGTGPDRGYDAASDALGNIYLGGYFSSTANFDSTDLGARDSRNIITKGGIDLFVAKYNSQGTLQWILEEGGSGEDIIRGVDLDQNLFHFAGHFADTIITEKSDTLASTGPTDEDVYFAITDLLGAIVSTGQTKGLANETTQALAYDGQGAEYLAGYFESASLEVGELTPLSNAGGRDGMLVKYSYPFSIALTERINVGCFGGNDGQLIVTPFFGKAPYLYEWDHNPALNDSIVSGLTAGSYKVIVTDDTGEVDSIEVDITEPTAIQIDKVILDVSCFNGTDGQIDITTTGGTPGYSYLWTTSNGTGIVPADEDQTGLGLGDYTVTVTDTNGCVQDSTFAVNQPTQLTIDGFVKENVSAPGAGDGWAKVIVSGGTPNYTYDWSTGSTIDSIFGLDGGTYNVEVSDANGCPSTPTSRNVVINEPGVPTVSLDSVNHISCKDSADGSAIAFGSGGTPPYTYTFSSGTVVEDSVVTNLGPGWLIVTLEDDLGAKAEDSVLISEPSGLVITKTLTDASCFGICDGIIDISVVGGTTPYSFSWDRDGEATEDLTQVCSGPLYTVTVTDANGCQGQNAGFVDQPAEMDLSFDVTNVTCFGENNGAIDLTVTGGTGTKSFLWSNTLTSPNIDFIFAGEYWVRVTDENNCQETDTATVNQPDELVVNAFELKPACFARTDGKAQAIVTGGVLPYTFIWDDPSAQTDSIAMDLDPNRSYIVDVSDSNGCVSTDTTFIYEQARITIETDTIVDEYCFGEPTGKIFVTLMNGQEPYSYFWVETGDITEDLINVPAGTYTLEAEDMFGCLLIPDYEGTIQNFIADELVFDSIIVVYPWAGGSQDGSITVYPSGGTSPYMYSFDQGAYRSENDTTLLNPGDYNIRVIDSKGCGPIITDTTLTSVSSVPSLSLSSIKIYPNPSTGKFTLEIQNEKGEDLMLEIINLPGQMVYKKLHKYDGQETFIRTIDLSKQASGAYFMRINGLPVKAKLMIE